MTCFEVKHPKGSDPREDGGVWVLRVKRGKTRHERRDRGNSAAHRYDPRDERDDARDDKKDHRREEEAEAGFGGGVRVEAAVCHTAHRIRATSAQSRKSARPADAEPCLFATQERR